MREESRGAGWRPAPDAASNGNGNPLPVIAFCAESIPLELRSRRQWVCWRGEMRRNGTLGKVPISPATLERCDATNAANWASFDRAWAAYLVHPELDGLGFALAGGVVAIDLDGAIDDAGEIRPWAAEIVENVRSYWEYSPSGRGLRAFVAGNWRGPNRCGRVEVYDRRRYVTVTGQRLQGASPDILAGAEARAALKRLHDGPWMAVAHLRMRDAAGRRLLRGDRSDYASASEADLALASKMAYWFAGDRARIVGALRASRLYRPKWDAPRAGRTYLDVIVDQALDTWRLQEAERESARLASPRAQLNDAGLRATQLRLAVMEAVAAIGPATGAAIARHIGRPPSTVRDALADLQRAGILQRDGSAGYVLARVVGSAAPAKRTTTNTHNRIKHPYPDTYADIGRGKQDLLDFVDARRRREERNLEEGGGRG